MTERLDAHEFIDAIADHGSFEQWDDPVDISEQPSRYRRELTGAFLRSHADEAVVTGVATIGGARVVVIVGEFSFLGGSIGIAASDRIEGAVRRATEERLPVLAAPASGGTRMQEGTPAFVRMADVVRAVMAHRAAGLLYVVYLRHPTIGGALASWGSLGQLTLAEPDALIAFLGPKVVAALAGRSIPHAVQRAEHLAAHGVVDAVVPVDELGVLLAEVLQLVGVPELPAALERRERMHDDVPGARRMANPWDSVVQSRSPQRPGLTDLLTRSLRIPLCLGGTGTGELAGPIRAGIARLDGRSVVLIGQDRALEAGGAPLGPGALRTAQRAMRLAGELGLPVVTIIDTAGAELSADAEEHAVAGEIARCAADLVSLRAPSVAVLLGQGCGGGALALLPAARVVAAENAWLAPLAPEGASTILYGDTEHAPVVAGQQTIRAVDLFDAGIVDAIVPEHGTDYAASPEAVAAFADAVLAEVVAQLREQDATAARDPRRSTVPIA